MKHNFKYSSLLTTLLLCPFLAQAQEITENKEAKLDTIKIESNKGPKNYSTSTESISIIPANQLDVPAQRDSLEAVNATPNISVNKNDGSFSIRGINNTGVTGYAKDNVSSILLDDIYQSDLAVKAGAFDMWDINHIEVYRGPQSTNQGVNSLAGSILLFKNKASENTEGGAKLGFGSYGKREAGVYYNGTSENKNLLYRITTNHEASDGFIKNETNGNNKWGKKEKVYLGLDLIYKLNENDHLRFNTKYMGTDNGGNYVNGPKPFEYKVYEDINYNSTTDNIQTSLRYFKKINEQWNNETILAFSKSTNKQISDADGTATDLAGARDERHRDQYISAENLLKYESGKIRNLLGVHAHVFKLHDHDDFTAVAAQTPVLVTINTLQNSDKTRSTIAVFNNIDYALDSNQTLSLGGRYEYVKNKFDLFLDGSVSPTGTPYDAVIAQMAGTRRGALYKGVFIPKIGYSYTQDQHTLGATITQGYRTGGVSVNRWQGTVHNYDPELTTNYELSYKKDGDFLKLSSNIFYTDWADQQVLVQMSTGQGYSRYDTQVMNAGSSKLYGAELEGQFLLSPKNSLSAGIGYVKTEFVDFKSATQDYAGNEFPLSPTWTGRLYHSYYATEALTINSILRYLSKSYNTAENDSTAPEQYYLDMSAQYLLPSMNLILEGYVKNVLNKKYVLYSHTYLEEYVQVSTPSEYGVRATLMF